VTTTITDIIILKKKCPELNLFLASFKLCTHPISSALILQQILFSVLISVSLTLLLPYFECCFDPKKSKTFVTSHRSNFEMEEGKKFNLTEYCSVPKPPGRGSAGTVPRNYKYTLVVTPRAFWSCMRLVDSSHGSTHACIVRAL